MAHRGCIDYCLLLVMHKYVDHRKIWKSIIILKLSDYYFFKFLLGINYNWDITATLIGAFECWWTWWKRSTWWRYSSVGCVAFPWCDNRARGSDEHQLHFSSYKLTASKSNNEIRIRALLEIWKNRLEWISLFCLSFKGPILLKIQFVSLTCQWNEKWEESTLHFFCLTYFS